jgi:hypothetical protein
LNKHSLRVAISALVAAVFFLNITGCSLVGLGIGAVVDSSRPSRFDARSLDQLTETSGNAEVVLVLIDSTKVYGRYEGLLRDEPGPGVGKPSSDSTRVSNAARIVIRGPSEVTTAVAVDSIAQFGLAAPKHGWLVGALVGLCVDVAVFVYVGYFMQWD